MPSIVGAAEKIAALFFDRGGLVFNVKHPDFGAKGDGVVDDTAAIQACLDAASAAGGGKVVVPKGSFKVSSTLNLSSYTKVSGTGKKSILIAVTAGMNLLSANAQDSCVVEKLALQGNSTAAIGVLVNSSPFCIVRRCTITGFTGLNASSYGGGVHVYLSDDITIDDNDCSSNGVLTGGLTSDIQINGNGAAPDCSKRVNIKNNRCLSTAVQTNIVAYDCAWSSATGNTCSGAKTQASNNNGYGIIFYGSVLHNPGTARRNRVSNNLIYSVGGSGIYIQGQNECAVVGNVVEDAGAVQTDFTLQVGGIVFSNSPNGTCSGNVVYDCKRTGIVVGGTAGNVYGFSVTGNNIDTVTSGSACQAIGIKINGPMKNSTIASNTIRNAQSAIATPPSDVAADGNVIHGNTIEGGSSGNGAIELYGVSRTTVSSNRILNSYRDGILITVGSGCLVVGNEIWNGSVAVDNTYFAINISTAPDTSVIANIGGNTGGTGYKHFVFVNSASPRTVVRSNKARAARTSNYNVDTTFANQVSFDGNFDDAVTNPQIFPMRQQAVLQGSATSMTQLLLGDSSSFGFVGTRWSGGDTGVGQNVSQVQGADLWHQSNGASASKLWILRANGDAEFYSAAAGTGDNTFATFWGTPKAAFTATSTVKLANTQVVKVQQAAVADVASANATDLATVITLANEQKTQLNALLNRLRASTGHGLIA